MPRHVVIIISALLLLVPSDSTGSYDPMSHIERPAGTGPTYVTATGGAGQVADGDGTRRGYTLAAVMRPHRAADFHNPFYAWNMALVLQIDKQGGGPATILSTDAIARRYLADMRGLEGGRAVFVGLGAGLSHASWSTPGAEGEPGTGGSADAFTFLAELGLEWNLDPALVLVSKGQYRLYDRGGHDLSGWTLQVGLGLPFPF